MTLLGFIVALIAAILLIPALVFFIECAASLFFGSGATVTRPEGVSLAVLIPAHDEVNGIGATIADVRSQLEVGDRIIVVADNCTDDTAAMARGAGAEVIERFAPEYRGKGYALAFGTNYLETDPPDLAIIVDADCRLTPGSLDALVAQAMQTQRPVQADYTLQPAKGSPLSMISAFAFLVRNRVRPRGLLQLGMPCHLTGTGMAFPWLVLRSAPDLGSNLVEDLAMGIELALVGHEPLLCTKAGVRSELPSGKQAASSQRRRWEHGQLATLFRYSPRLIRTGFARGRLGLVAMGADLMVPPLALLVGLLVLVFALAGLVALLGGGWTGVGIAGVALALVTLGVAIAWVGYGRTVIPFRYLLLTPFYIVWKAPLYAAFLLGRRERQWQRTER
ncbi:MAG: glycosyltransferase family 2 protein [Myxococcales bacterium]|nr:glycosyltransferase family 2 protein [Myxococcales bacterium]